MTQTSSNLTSNKKPPDALVNALNEMPGTILTAADIAIFPIVSSNLTYFSGLIAANLAVFTFFMATGTTQWAERYRHSPEEIMKGFQAFKHAIPTMLVIALQVPAIALQQHIPALNTPYFSNAVPGILMSIYFVIVAFRLEEKMSGLRVSPFKRLSEIIPTINLVGWYMALLANLEELTSALQSVDAQKGKSTIDTATTLQIGMGALLTMNLVCVAAGLKKKLADRLEDSRTKTLLYLTAFIGLGYALTPVNLLANEAVKQPALFAITGALTAASLFVGWDASQARVIEVAQEGEKNPLIAVV